MEKYVFGVYLPEVVYVSCVVIVSQIQSPVSLLLLTGGYFHFKHFLYISVFLCRILVNTQSSLLLMNFEPITYDYTLEEDVAPVTKTPTPPILSPSALKRRKLSLKQRQASASSKSSQKSLPVPPVEEKKKELTVLFDNENIDLDLSLEQTKELLKRQMRGGVDESRKLVPEEFRTIQQSPFYRANKSTSYHR